jgi:hypothetical protein
MKYVVNDDVVLSQPLEGPLSAHIGAFAQWARDLGYARGSRYRQVHLAACFSRWLGQQAVAVRRVSAEHRARYLQCRARRHRRTSTVPRSAVGPQFPTDESGALYKSVPRSATVGLRLNESARRGPRNLARAPWPRTHPARLTDRHGRYKPHETGKVIRPTFAGSTPGTAGRIDHMYMA